MRTLVVIADAAAHTGVGHFVRTLALADAAADRGWSPVVALADDTVDWARQQVAARGWPAVATRGPQHSLDDLASAGVDPARSVVVVDTYRLDGPALSGMRRRTGRLVVVDDLADRLLDADLVVNQNVTADRLSMRLGEGTRVLAGPTYALLREAFSRRRPEALASVAELGDVPRRVLTVMGGTDPTGSALLAAAAAARAFPAASVDVIASGATSLDAPRVRVLPRQDDLAELMLAADLVVTAAGSTVWEVFCLARAVAAVEVAANQHDVYERLSHDGHVVGLGATPIDIEVTERRLREAFSASGRLRSLAQGGSRVVDGQGSDRVVDAIEQLGGRAHDPGR